MHSNWINQYDHKLYNGAGLRPAGISGHSIEILGFLYCFKDSIECRLSDSSTCDQFGLSKETSIIENWDKNGNKFAFEILVDRYGNESIQDANNPEKHEFSGVWRQYPFTRFNKPITGPEYVSQLYRQGRFSQNEPNKKGFGNQTPLKSEELSRKQVLKGGIGVSAGVFGLNISWPKARGV